MGRFVLFIILCTVILSTVSFGETYSGGTGATDDPYKIATAADWQTLMGTPEDWSKTFILVSDINLAETAITPVGNNSINFTGFFDGNGHVIRNAVMHQPDSDYLGLFGYVSNGGQICYLGLEDATVIGRQYVGTLVSYSQDSHISFCYASGTVNGASNVGGLVGHSTESMIDTCYALSSVSGTSNVGGLVGFQSSGTISTCYSTGAVTGSSDAGGLVGLCSSSEITACFWDTQTSECLTSAGGTGKTTAEMMTLSTFSSAGWSISDITGDADWIIHPDGQSYPQIIHFFYRDPSDTVPLFGDGTEQNPYQIGSPADLVSLGQYPSVWSQHIILTAELDMTDITIYPIGNLTVTFRGSFNGQNFAIRHAAMNLPNRDFVGLFGKLGDGAAITNVNAENVNIVGKRYVGGLIGYNSQGQISNCRTTGLVCGHSLSYVGGLAGFNAGGTITNCSSSVSVNGLGASAGGLAAVNSSGGVIINCHASGTVTDTDAGAFGACAGGLVARNAGEISRCSATGDIHASSFSPDAFVNAGALTGHNSCGGIIHDSFASGHVLAGAAAGTTILEGGLVGLNSFADVNDCYAQGPVVFDCNSQSNCFFGGLAGINAAGSIRCCYTNSAVDTGELPQDDSCIGGFCGINLGGNIYSSFWDVQTGSLSNSAGGKGMTTEQMKMLSVYQNAGWSDRGWVIEDGQDYPHLAWENSGGTAVPAASAVPLSGNGTTANPYQIGSLNDLSLLNQYSSASDKCFTLMTDVDAEWIPIEPIGSMAPFTGTFDGNGHTIRNITVMQPTDSYVGLFKHVETGGVIKNLGIENADITGGDYVGGLLGKNHGGTVSHCHFTGTVGGFSHTGGLLGSHEGGSITHCYSNAVTASSDPGDPNPYAGGLAGYSAGSITACYTLGEVSGFSYVGGLTGCQTAGSIEDSYSHSPVTGFRTIGGLAGLGIDIASSYSTGGVTGTSNVGGLTGSGPSGDITACFWDTQTSGCLTSAGGTGKTTVEMKIRSTFTDAGWDFLHIWRLCEDGGEYPYFRHQAMPADFVCPDGVELNDLGRLADEWLAEKRDADMAPDGGDGFVDLLDWQRLDGAWLTSSASENWEAACDIAPAGGDGSIDVLDLEVLTDSWLSPSVQYCDVAPAPEGDGRVDLQDFSAFAGYWLQDSGL